MRFSSFPDASQGSYPSGPHLQIREGRCRLAWGQETGDLPECQTNRSHSSKGEIAYNFLNGSLQYIKTIAPYYDDSSKSEARGKLEELQRVLRRFLVKDLLFIEEGQVAFFEAAVEHIDRYLKLWNYLYDGVN